MHPIISIKNISKQYRLGTVGTGTMSNDLKRWWYNVRGKEDPFLKIGETNVRSSKGTSDYVWALKDISFDVMPGEVLGIIGKNGAGKSTLLKILSKVTGPTTGSIDYNGRIGSLLEVGTGFHPELTGRENIFLNGAILGMTKTEIRSKLDEIVDFSGCERYIDTPVKRYSSGMMVRLGFAVAAHLEPEILVVDEVLAVGDAEFQKKAIGKMQDVSRNDGRTVLFVSHNMAAVKSLCSRGIVLEDGKNVFDGDQMSAVINYQNTSFLNKEINFLNDIDNAPGNEKIRILKFSVTPCRGEIIQISSGCKFELIFFNMTPNINLDATFELKNNEEITVFHQGSLISKNKDSMTGVYKVTGIIPPDTLNAGLYKFKLIFGQDQRYPLYVKEDTIEFDVLNEMHGSNAKLLPGIIRMDLQFAQEYINDIAINES